MGTPIMAAAAAGPLRLEITLDHEDGVYRVQQWMKGRLFVHAPEDGTPLHGKVIITLTGKETTWLPRTSCMGKVTELARVFFKEERIVHEFNNMHSAATARAQHTYSYPFSIYLPPTQVVPSMVFEDVVSGGCSVTYVLEAQVGTMADEMRTIQVVNPIATTITMTTTNRSSSTGTLLAAAKPAATAPQVVPYSLPPVCLSPGTSLESLVDDACFVVAAKVDNTHVSKSGTLECSLSCRNLAARVDIKRVDLRLLEEISWVAPATTVVGKPHVTTHVNTLEYIKDVVMDGLHKTRREPQKRQSNTPRPTWKHGPSGPEVNNMLRGEMHADVMAQRNKLRIHVPSTALDSYDGTKLIKVKHYLKITLVTRDKLNDPHVLIPIKILDLPAERSSSSSLTMPTQQEQQRLHQNNMMSQSQSPEQPWNPAMTNTTTTTTTTTTSTTPPQWPDSSADNVILRNAPDADLLLSHGSANSLTRLTYTMMHEVHIAE